MIDERKIAILAAWEISRSVTYMLQHDLISASNIIDVGDIINATLVRIVDAYNEIEEKD